MKSTRILLPLGSLLLSPRSSQGFLSKAECIVRSPSVSTRHFASSGSIDAASSLPPLLDVDGTEIPHDGLAEKLVNKRVALYFSAGWCPMCTSFEPSLLQFREASAQSGKPVELIYVPSDRSSSDQTKRAAALGMWSVPFGEEADNVKRKFKVWSGAESSKLGIGRRSGVPALIVLDKEKGRELAFVPAESEGANALGSWSLDDTRGVW
jgi:thiol-disulfide isomerase/thioredoxin